MTKFETASEIHIMVGVRDAYASRFRTSFIVQNKDICSPPQISNNLRFSSVALAWRGTTFDSGVFLVYLSTNQPGIVSSLLSCFYLSIYRVACDADACLFACLACLDYGASNNRPSGGGGGGEEALLAFNCSSNIYSFVFRPSVAP